MIDIENDVFNTIAVVVRASYSTASVYGESVLTPASFPCVCIEEIDNYRSKVHMDADMTEKYADIVYEVNVYSNKTTGKKSEAKAILNLIDAKMTSLGFRRQSKKPVSMDSTTIYRVVARYKAVVSKNNKIYGGY